MTTGFQLGIIEGYYGRPWSWAERHETLRYLAPHGYRFYFYAPKADPHLRRLWREAHPEETAREIERLSATARAEGVRFGAGLSPTKIHLDFGAASKEALAQKLSFLDEMQVQDLGLLFDDMRGDLPDLAERQVEIVHWAAERTKANRVIMCPSYYTDDPILDRIFGARPPGYLERLGELLDPAVDVFWTGEEVCSRAISASHIQRVASQLRRNPFLWDNYPVNDGERMSQYLFVRGFTGRDPKLREHLAAHGVNPSLQPTLARVPALTLVESYKQGTEYSYGAATRRAAIQVLGDELGQKLYEDVLFLGDFGLDRLGKRADELRSRWQDVDHAAAREIIGWLDGEYRITDEIIHQQAGE